MTDNRCGQQENNCEHDVKIMVGAQGPMGPQGRQGDRGVQGLPGAPGPRGLRGDKGDRGPQGDAGPKGEVGAKGEAGPGGPEGSQGDKGGQGPQGIQGSQGIQGPKGDKGDIGEQGPIGPIGCVGPRGANGEQGIQGPKGEQGIQGLKGDTGAQGPRGDRGDTGIQGDTGEAGPQGPEGPKGNTGSSGPKGPKGDKGDKGDTGLVGPQGPQGDVGPKGKDVDYADIAFITATTDMATKTYVNQQDNLKADKETTYTKAETDSTFAKKASTVAGYGITDTYIKSEVDTKILNKSVNSLSLDNADTLSLKLADNTTKTVSLTSVFTNNIEKGIDDSNVKVKQPFIGSVERSLHDKNNDTISVKDFGAKGDGITDDTQALQNWLNALSSKVSGFIPSGNYIFKQTLRKPDTTVITGCGSSSMLTYAGTATDIDLLDFGVSSKNTDKWVLQNFLVTSDTKMTSGYAMRFRRFSDTFIDKVIVEGMDLHKFNLYHGYFFDGCHEVWLSHFQAFCQGNGISVCGWNDQSNCDLYLSNGYANFCKNGIVVGGGFGGLFLGNNIELLGNSKTNMTIDQSLNNQSNREVLIDSIGCFDGIWGTPVGLLIDCPDSTAMQILIEGYICSNTEKLIYIKSAPNGHVSIKSSKLFNSKNHGVVIDDPTTRVVIGNGTTISNNVGWAVFATAETKLVYSEAVMHDNGGKYSHNVKNQDWQTYAVNYSATSGNFNYLHAYGRYKIVGGVCHFTVEVVCDDVGTASGAFFIQLPVPPRNFVVAVGRDNGNTGKVVIGNCPNYTGDMMLITTFDNYFPVYNGSRLLLAGSYEYDRTVR